MTHHNEYGDNILGAILGTSASLAGIFMNIIPDVTSIAHTVILSIIGAGVGFLTSFLLKKFTK
jgi:hypothetical protein